VLPETRTCPNSSRDCSFLAPPDPSNLKPGSILPRTRRIPLEGVVQTSSKRSLTHTPNILANSHHSDLQLPTASHTAPRANSRAGDIRSKVPAATPGVGFRFPRVNWSQFQLLPSSVLLERVPAHPRLPCSLTYLLSLTAQPNLTKGASPFIPAPDRGGGLVQIPAARPESPCPKTATRGARQARSTRVSGRQTKS
jgi:hypothetical protein